MPAVAEQLHHLLELPVLVQALLAEPLVELDAQQIEVLPGCGEHPRQPGLAEALDRLRFRHIEELVAALGYYLRGEVFHVLAVVAVLRHLGVPPETLLVAGVERAPEGVYLAAGVVEVILLLHAVAGGAEDVGQGAAQNGAAPVADVQRAGGVDADELHLHPGALADVDIAEGLPGRADYVHLLCQPGVFQREVDEARRGGYHAFYLGRWLDQLGQVPCDVQRVSADGAGQLQWEARGVVAVLRVLRTLDGHLRQGNGWQLAGLLRPGRRLDYQVCERLLEHLSPRSGAEIRRARRARPIIA